MLINMNGRQRLGISESGVQAALKRLRIRHKKILTHPKTNIELRQMFETKIKSLIANIIR